MAIESPERGLLLSLARRSIEEGLGLRIPVAPPQEQALPPALLEQKLQDLQMAHRAAQIPSPGIEPVAGN